MDSSRLRDVVSTSHPYLLDRLVRIERNPELLCDRRKEFVHGHAVIDMVSDEVGKIPDVFILIEDITCRQWDITYTLMHSTKSLIEDVIEAQFKYFMRNSFVDALDGEVSLVGKASRDDLLKIDEV